MKSEDEKSRQQLQTRRRKPALINEKVRTNDAPCVKGVQEGKQQRTSKKRVPTRYNKGPEGGEVKQSKKNGVDDKKEKLLPTGQKNKESRQLKKDQRNRKYRSSNFWSQ